MSVVPARGSTWDPRRIVAQRGSIAGKRVARLLRARYARRLRAGRLPELSPPRAVPVDMISFSCERDLPEQVLSIRSFLRYVGEPASFTVVSDGTISASSAAILRALAPAVDVVSVADYAAGVPVHPAVREFADSKAYGRKLIALTAMRPAGRPVGYADSDVLFHRGGAGLAAHVASLGEAAHFLQDCQEALDVRLVPPAERHPPLNSGFLLTGRVIDWADATRRLATIGEADAPGYGWTEQSVVHLAYRASGAVPLPPRACVVALHDQFSWGDEHVGPAVWLRHYVTGTRFKMWLCLLGAVEP
jgi:hypothetical protein